MRVIKNKENEKLLKKYLMVCKNKGLTPNTQKAFEIELRLFLDYIGDMKLEDVTHMVIDDFLLTCQEERHNGSQAISRKYVTLNNFFNVLISKDYLNMKNPMAKVEKIKVRRKIKDYLTEDEVNRVFKYVEDSNDLRGQALVFLLYSSALRISEVYQLNRNSLNFETRKFKVLGKGMRERDCYFSEEAKEKILQYLESRTDDLEPLFISREHNRWSRKAIQEYIKRIIKEVGIKKHITPHSFRHSILTNMRLNGALLEDLQLLAGHLSISTTQAVYTHVGLNEVSNKFDNFFEKMNRKKEGD